MCPLRIRRVSWAATPLTGASGIDAPSSVQGFTEPRPDPISEIPINACTNRRERTRPMSNTTPRVCELNLYREHFDLVAAGTKTIEVRVKYPHLSTSPPATSSASVSRTPTKPAR